MEGPIMDIDTLLDEQPDATVLMVDRLHRPGEPIPLEALLLLIRAEAFRFTGRPARTLLWAAHRRLGHRPPPAPGSR